MKIRKLTVFLLAFFIGYFSVPPKEKISVTVKTAFDIPFALPPQVFVEPKVESKTQPKFEPEIFDVPDVSEDEPKFKMRLIDVIKYGNNYRKEEMKAKSGQIWLGLFRKNGRHHLLDTKISIKPERRPDYGDDSVTLKVDKNGAPAFLLKNAKKLRKGEVETLFARPSHEEAERLGIELSSMKQGFFETFELNGRKYTLQVKEGLTKSKEKILALVLESGKSSQIIHFIYYSGAGDYVGNLLWVGDLDRDGKLDLYMDFYGYEKGSYSSGLFLSTEAEKGELVKQVADFSTLGC